MSIGFYVILDRDKTNRFGSGLPHLHRPPQHLPHPHAVAAGREACIPVPIREDG